jgi:hypothetical protein
MLCARDELGSLRQGSSGVFVVRYEVDDDLLPEKQRLLLEAVRAGPGSSAIVFVLAPGIWKVDLSVPQFWSKVVTDKTLPLRAMAIVSGSVAVRAATHTFRVGVMLSGHKLAVASMQDEAAAVQWARQALRPEAAASP